RTAQACGRAGAGASRRMVLPRRSAQPHGRSRRSAGGVRARGRDPARQPQGALRHRKSSRPPESPGRSHGDVSPLAGNDREVIRVVVDDLASFAADELVRPATTHLDPTAAALRRLEIVGGEEFQNRIRLSRELAVGAAVVTAAGGDLPAEFVIHAVIRSETEPVTRDGVARAWQSALQRAQEWEFASLTAPPIGTGAGNLAIEDAAEVMVQVLKAHAGNAAFPS